MDSRSIWSRYIASECPCGAGPDGGGGDDRGGALGRAIRLGVLCVLCCAAAVGLFAVRRARKARQTAVSVSGGADAGSIYAANAGGMPPACVK
eukprot:SAG22_NODE_188_length_15821_cov_38.313319_9_plen_93_part_00